MALNIIILLKNSHFIYKLEYVLGNPQPICIYEDSLRPLDVVVFSSIDTLCLSPTYLQLGLSSPRLVTTGFVNNFSTNIDSQFDDPTKVPHKNNTTVSKPTYLYIYVHQSSFYQRTLQIWIY